MKTVAVVGASNDRSKFGNKALRAFQAEGYRTIPVNPNEPVVEGQTSYASVLDIPGPVDMATVYVNPGAEDDGVISEARRRGLNTIFACSIIGIGQSPADF
jgi:predicted CoA-binding protein